MIAPLTRVSRGRYRLPTHFPDDVPYEIYFRGGADLLPGCRLLVPETEYTRSGRVLDIKYLIDNNGNGLDMLYCVWSEPNPLLTHLQTQMAEQIHLLNTLRFPSDLPAEKIKEETHQVNTFTMNAVSADEVRRGPGRPPKGTNHS